MVVGVEQTTIYICENRDDQVHPESPSFLLLLLLYPGPDWFSWQAGGAHTQEDPGQWRGLGYSFLISSQPCKKEYSVGSEEEEKNSGDWRVARPLLAKSQKGVWCAGRYVLGSLYGEWLVSKWWQSLMWCSLLMLQLLSSLAEHTHVNRVFVWK